MVSPPPKSCEVMQCRFRLLQVEGHVHLAVHRHGLGEMLTRLLPLAGSKIESTEAEMTVGDQRAHTAVRRNHERLAIVVLTLSTIGSFGMSRDVSKQVMRIGHVSVKAAGAFDGSLCDSGGLLDLTEEHICAAQRMICPRTVADDAAFSLSLDSSFRLL